MNGVSKKNLIAWALGLLALSAMTGIAFAAWFNNGGEMLKSMYDAGLAWCM